MSRSFGLRSSPLKLGLVALTTFLGSTAAASAGEPEDGTREVPLADGCVVDPEIWQGGDRLAWQDPCTNTLWMAPLDPATGQWRLEEAKRIAWGLAPIDRTKNAAEWGFSQRGPELYFTQLDPASGSAVTVASDLDAPRPSIRTIAESPERDRYLGIPFPSKDADDDEPQVVYYDRGPHNASLRWKEANLAGRAEAEAPGQPVPNAQAAVFKGPRWIPGERSLLVTRGGVADGAYVSQVFAYDIDDESYTQLTFEDRSVLDGQMAVLPGGEQVLLATWDQRGVAVYREGEAGGFTLDRILFADEAGDDGSVTLWEPFLFQGRLYVVAQVADGEGPYTPSRLWIGAATGEPWEVPVCGPSDGTIRFDPEAYIGAQGAYVYYYDPTDHSFFVCDTPLRREGPRRR